MSLAGRKNADKSKENPLTSYFRWTNPSGAQNRPGLQSPGGRGPGDEAPVAADVSTFPTHSSPRQHVSQKTLSSDTLAAIRRFK